MGVMTSGILSYVKKHGADILIRILCLFLFWEILKQTREGWELYLKFLAAPQAAIGNYQAHWGITVSAIKWAFCWFFVSQTAALVWLWFPAKKWWSLWQLFWLLLLTASGYDWLHIQLDPHYRCCDFAITNMAEERMSYIFAALLNLLALTVMYIKPPKRKYAFWGFLAFSILCAYTVKWFNLF